MPGVCGVLVEKTAVVIGGVRHTQCQQIHIGAHRMGRQALKLTTLFNDYQ